MCFFICTFFIYFLLIFADLNQLNSRSPGKLVKVLGIQTPDKDTKFIVNKETNYADNVLVVGKKYQNRDIKCGSINNLGKFSSGVLGM